MLLDAVQTELPNLRAQAESLMVESVVITRGGGAPVFNPTTGDYDTPAGTTIYTGPCQARKPENAELDRLFGEREVTIFRYTLSVPWTVDNVEHDDVAVVTGDVEITGKTCRVVAVIRPTFVVTTNLVVEVVK